MKNVSKLGLLAFLIAAVAALAFTPQKNESIKYKVKKNGATEYVWLKFNCSEEGGVQTSGDINWAPDTGIPTSGVFAPCTGGSNYVCAILVDADDTEPVNPANPNIITLKEGATLPDPDTEDYRYIYCES